MNRKKRLAVFVAFALVLICLSACRAAVQAGFTPDTEVQSTLDVTLTEEPDGGGASTNHDKDYLETVRKLGTTL